MAVSIKRRRRRLAAVMVVDTSAVLAVLFHEPQFDGLAITLDASLLYKRTDFSKTDVRSALD